MNFHSISSELKPKQITKGGKRWWLVDLRRIKQGRRYFHTKEEAKECADQHAWDLYQNGQSYFEMTAEDRTEWAAVKAKLKPYGLSILDAVSIAIRYTPQHTKTLERAIHECLMAKERAGKRPIYLNSFRRTLLDFSTGREKDDCTAVTTEEIEAWINNPGWAPGTRRSQLISLKTFFSWCLRRRIIAVNPAEPIERPTLEDRPPGILTVSQCQDLLEAVLVNDLELLPYVALGLFSGIRPEEMSRLHTTEINLETGLVEIKGWKSKTRKRRLVPISDNCRVWLEICRTMPVPNAARRLRWVRDKAGIKEWPSDAMRHSFASYHLALHGDAGRTATVMGHSSTHMLFAHYRELVQPTEGKAFFEITPANPEQYPSQPAQSQILKLPIVSQPSQPSGTQP